MRRGRNAASRLRAAVDMLPTETKQAMLVALENETIVTGAYTHDGGICPMLAAHRRGGRTDRESFAQSWDRYTGADKGRRATEREIRTLRSMLEASLMEPIDLHSVAPAKKRKGWDTGEHYRMGELRKQHGWAWSRLFRRYDTYAAALEQMEMQAPQDERERELVG